MRSHFIAAAALVFQPLWAAAQLSITPDKLTIDAARGGSVLVKNGGTSQANAALTLFTAPLPGGCALMLKPATMTIAPGFEEWLPVAIDAPAPCESGSYPGRLQAAPGAAPSDVTIQVAGFALPQSWKVTLYRAFPATSLYLDDTFSIPVQVTPPARVPTNAELVLPRDNGASLFGQGWLTLMIVAPSAAKELPFRVEGGGQVGKYSADVTIPGAAAPTKFEVAVKDMVLWPLLVIGASIMLTLKVQRFMAVDRPILEWKSRTARAETTLQALPSGTEAFGYDITADFNEQRSQTDLAASKFDAPGSDDQARIEQSVAQLEQVPPAWQGFVAALQQLATVLSALPSSLTSPPPDAARTGQSAPRIVTDAQGMLAGGTITVAQWRVVLGKLSAVSPVLSAILPLGQQLSEYAAVPGPTSALQTAIDAAASKLWRVGNAEDLARLAIPADLDAIAALVLVLPPGTRPLATVAVPLAVAVFPAQFELPAVQVRRIAMQIAGMDQRLAWLAVAIAVLLGLRDYYFDATFGSLKDYAGLVIYGTGTKLAIDLVRTSLQALTGRRAL